MMDSQPAFDCAAPASFRDPAGRLFRVGERVIRIVNSKGAADLEAFLASSTSRRFVEEGRLIGTRILDPAVVACDVEFAGIRSDLQTEGSLILEHDRIPFQSFPYEWPPEMLYAAGELTLDLAASLLDEGLGLKDATPYNVLFRGPDAVFVDLLSFERRTPGDPTWLPYAQFVRTFLMPLLVNRYFGVALDQLLISRRDGLEPEDVYRLAGWFQRLSPPLLSLVSIPTWLNARHDPDNLSIYRSKTLDNHDKARFIIGVLLKRLRRTLNTLAPKRDRSSAWSDYRTCNNNYTEPQLRAKERFVDAVITEFRPQRVLDVGCNTGEFSLIGAKKGARVVAIDSDAVVVGETWRRACSEGFDILPMVINLTRPSPAIGWRNSECSSFLDRARGAFDAVLMLAVMHHMLVSERIPLDEIIDVADEMTTDILVIEFIAPDDSMFRRLARGRDHLFTDLTTELFENNCRRKFEIVRSQRLEGASRWLYLLRKRGTRANA
jgi:SAM-dependent methyltransferase